MNPPTEVLVDNQSVISLAPNNAVNRRNKQIDVRYQFSRQEIQDGLVYLRYCPIDEMVADMFTKPLGLVKLQKFVAVAGMDIAESAKTQ